MEATANTGESKSEGSDAGGAEIPCCSNSGHGHTMIAGQTDGDSADRGKRFPCADVSGQEDRTGKTVRSLHVCMACINRHTPKAVSMCFEEKADGG